MPEFAASHAARRLVDIVVVLCLVVGTAALYAHRLSDAPPYLEIDEALIGLDARSTAQTGRDLSGRFLPLYFQTAEHSWYQPMVIYATAAALEMLPFDERSIRVPTVCVAVLDVVLMYFVAWRLFRNPVVGGVAALLLMLTPSHFIHARYAMDYIYPLPFVLGWMLCLIAYRESHEPFALAAAGAVLGVGCYSYIASLVMMPIYLAITWVVLYRSGPSRRTFAIATAPFVVLLVPFAVWLLRHPTAFGATVTKYGLYDSSRLSVFQGMRSMLHVDALADRLSQYWNYFNPSFLFFRGPTKVMFSTNRTGVFLAAIAPLVVVGLVDSARRASAEMYGVLIAGFLTAPLAALIVAEPEAVFRAMALLPFGILLAAAGVRALAAVRFGRVAVSLLMVVAVVQFAWFRRDYLTDYRERSAFWLGGNVGGAMEMLIARADRDHAPAIYFATLQSSAGQIDGRDQYLGAYWDFYLAKHERTELAARTGALSAMPVSRMATGSLVLSNAGNASTAPLVRRGELHAVETVPELGHGDDFMILQR
jgi:4-amino-4-deoxy-L-arabinose transferase-like glycosyltransferase